MPISQRILESYKSLRLTLRHLLKGQRYELSIEHIDAQSLLVLETLGDAVGFTIDSDTPETTYSAAYNAFKQLYRQKHDVWKERNLSFVVCRSHPMAVHDPFFNAIEMDVYFCRKYVLNLYTDEEGAIRELLRLPFLPFPEGRAGGVTRPPSAQSLLQRHGVNAILARQLIAPGMYSARNIINSLTAQPEVVFDPNNSLVSGEQYGVYPTESTRLKKLTIEAFRAYRKKQEFALAGC